MSALKSLYNDIICRITLRGLICPVLEIAGSVKSARTADTELALVLRVEIEEAVAMANARVEAFCDRNSGVFVISDKNLDRTMLD